MNKFLLLSARLIGLVALMLFSYALFRHVMPKAPASPVLLFASYESGVNGTLLEFHADGTFAYENMGFGPSEVIIGRYTRMDSLIQLDRLPRTEMLKHTMLLVRPSLATETGQGIWPVGPTGRVDSMLAVFTIFPPALSKVI